MKKNIIPDINLQNEIQKNKILNSRDFYKGKSFRFAHEWHDGITYFNDDFYTDFVVYKNVLFACKNTHTSNSLNVPVIIYDGVQPIGVENTEYWSFVLSGIANTDASFKVQFSPSVDALPTASEHIGEIFVVGPIGELGNAYSEYIAIHTPSYDEEYTWELIGGGNVSVDLSEHYTKTESDEKYQLKGDYLTSIPDEYITETELESKKYLTSIPSEYVTESELSDKNYATEQWIENKGYLTSIPDTYVTEDELNDRIQYITTNINFDGGETNFIDNGTDTI